MPDTPILFFIRESVFIFYTVLNPPKAIPALQCRTLHLFFFFNKFLGYCDIDLPEASYVTSNTSEKEGAKSVKRDDKPDFVMCIHCTNLNVGVNLGIKEDQQAERDDSQNEQSGAVVIKEVILGIQPQLRGHGMGESLVGHRVDGVINAGLEELWQVEDDREEKDRNDVFEDADQTRPFVIHRLQKE